jgi:hypothetical protein
MDKTFTTWDNNPKEDNLEDVVLVLEQLENALIDDDHVKIPTPSTIMVPLTKTPVVTIWASCSIPLPSTSTHSYLLLRLHYHHVEAHAAIVVQRGRESR